MILLNFERGIDDVPATRILQIEQAVEFLEHLDKERSHNQNKLIDIIEHLGKQDTAQGKQIEILQEQHEFTKTPYPTHPNSN